MAAAAIVSAAVVTAVAAAIVVTAIIVTAAIIAVAIVAETIVTPTNLNIKIRLKLIYNTIIYFFIDTDKMAVQTVQPNILLKFNSVN